MITKNLANALSDIGFTYADGEKSASAHCYAVYGGYLVSAYEDGGKKKAYFSFRFNENEENAIKRYDMSEQFSAETEEFEVTDYELGEDGLKVVCGGSIATFLKLIDKCVSMLIEHDIKGVEYCSSCGNKFGKRKPKKVTYGCDEHLMCERCAIEALEEYNNAKTESAHKDARVLPGIIGSALFALLGSALFIAMYWWLCPAVMGNGTSDIRYIVCAAGAVVAALAFVGYRLFCKKISAAAYISVSVFSLLFTAAGQYLGSVLLFLKINPSGTVYPCSALSNKAFWLIHLRNTIPADAADQFADQSGVFYKLLAISAMFAAVCAAILLLSLRDKSIARKEPLKVETISVASSGPKEEPEDAE